jgi:hypothetical protein
MSLPSHATTYRMVIASAPGHLRLSFLTGHNGSADNRAYPPRFESPQMQPGLPPRESEMIERLLELCTEYQHQGKHDLAALIDRIGMRMMQMFLERLEQNTPAEPQDKPQEWPQKT